MAISLPSSSRVTVDDEATIERSSRSGHVLARVPGHRGPVLPGGQVDDREELLGHGQQRARGDLGSAVLAGPGVLLLDGLAHRRDSAPDELLGHRDLFRFEGGQGRVPVGGRRGQPAGIVPTAGLPPTGPGRAGPATGTTIGTGGAGLATVPPGTVAASPFVAIVPRPAVRSSRSGPTGAVAGTVRSLVAAALGLGCQYHIDVRSPLWGPDDLDPLDGPGSGFALGSQQRGHRRPVQGGLDLGRGAQSPPRSRPGPTPRRVFPAAAWRRRHATSRWSPPSGW